VSIATDRQIVQGGLRISVRPIFPPIGIGGKIADNGGQDTCASNDPGESVARPVNAWTIRSRSSESNR
jgi:hypothetical protein